MPSLASPVEVLERLLWTLALVSSVYLALVFRCGRPWPVASPRGSRRHVYGVSLTPMLVFLFVVPSVVVLLSLALVSSLWLALAFR